MFYKPFASFGLLSAPRDVGDFIFYCPSGEIWCPKCRQIHSQINLFDSAGIQDDICVLVSALSLCQFAYSCLANPALSCTVIGCIIFSVRVWERGSQAEISVYIKRQSVPAKRLCFLACAVQPLTLDEMTSTTMKHSSIKTACT